MTTSESIIEKTFKTIRSKIELNAYLPALASDEFYFFDPEMAEKITKEGRKQIKKQIKKFEKLGCKVEIVDD